MIFICSCMVNVSTFMPASKQITLLIVISAARIYVHITHIMWAATPWFVAYSCVFRCICSTSTQPDKRDNSCVHDDASFSPPLPYTHTSPSHISHIHHHHMSVTNITMTYQSHTSPSHISRIHHHHIIISHIRRYTSVVIYQSHTCDTCIHYTTHAPHLYLTRCLTQHI